MRLGPHNQAGRVRDGPDGGRTLPGATDAPADHRHQAHHQQVDVEPRTLLQLLLADDQSGIGEGKGRLLGWRRLAHGVGKKKDKNEHDILNESSLRQV